MFQIHDVPEFLGGDLKNKAQHILLTYKSPLAPSPSSPRSHKTPPPIQEASSQGLASSLLTASALLRLDFDETVQPSPSGSYTDRSIRDQVILDRKLNSTRNKMSNSEGSIPHLLEQERLQGSSLQTVKDNHLSVPVRGRPLPPPPTGETTASYSYQHRKTRRKRQQSQDLNSSSSSNELDFSSYRDDLSNDALSDRTDISSSYNDHLERRRASYSHTTKSKSVDDAEYVVESFKEESVDEESRGVTEELHLYILEQGSPMFKMVKSTWKNCIMVR